MIVNFKYIGIPLENLTNETQAIEINENSSIDKLLVELSKKYSNIDLDFLKKCTFMINNKSAERDTVLYEGNTLLIMKVLGGG